MIIALDFDRTILDTDNPEPGHKMGAPLPGAVESIQRLYDMGHKIVIHSCRANEGQRSIKVMTDWLNHFQIPYHSIWGESSSDIGKIVADCYVDDRGLQFISWEDVLEKLDWYGR